MEKVSTVWKFAVFSFILTAGLSDNNVCPKETTTTYPVVHMCTDDVIIQKNDFFIDVFVSAATPTTCTCTLQTTSYVQINASAVIAPVAPCDSEIRINTERVLKFQCVNGLDRVYTTTNFGPGDISIQLRTEVSNKDTTYCIHIAKSLGTGHLSLKCFSPHTTTPATTTPTQTSTPTSTPKSTPTSPLTSPPKSTPTSTPKSTPTSRPPDASTSDAPHTRTSTPVITSSERQQGSGSDCFPVAGAVAIGAVGVLLIEAVLVSIVVVYRRLSQRKPCQNNTGNGVTYVNGNVNTSSVYDYSDNNYDQLQHTNQPSSVDQEHVYLHVTGQTSSVQNKPDTSEQSQYVNMKTKT